MIYTVKKIKPSTLLGCGPLFGLQNERLFFGGDDIIFRHWRGRKKNKLHVIKIHVLYNYTYYKSKKATHGPHTQKVALHIAVLAASFITWPCPCKGRYFEVLVDKNAEVLD